MAAMTDVLPRAASGAPPPPAGEQRRPAALGALLAACWAALAGVLPAAAVGDHRLVRDRRWDRRRGAAGGHGRLAGCARGSDRVGGRPVRPHPARTVCAAGPSAVPGGCLGRPDVRGHQDQVRGGRHRGGQCGIRRLRDTRRPCLRHGRRGSRSSPCLRPRRTPRDGGSRIRHRRDERSRQPALAGRP